MSNGLGTQLLPASQFITNLLSVKIYRKISFLSNLHKKSSAGEKIIKNTFAAMYVDTRCMQYFNYQRSSDAESSQFALKTSPDPLKCSNAALDPILLQ